MTGWVFFPHSFFSGIKTVSSCSLVGGWIYRRFFLLFSALFARPYGKRHIQLEIHWSLTLAGMAPERAETLTMSKTLFFLYFEIWPALRTSLLSLQFWVIYIDIGLFAVSSKLFNRTLSWEIFWGCPLETGQLGKPLAVARINYPQHREASS